MNTWNEVELKIYDVLECEFKNFIFLPSFSHPDQLQAFLLYPHDYIADLDRCNGYAISFFNYEPISFNGEELIKPIKDLNPKRIIRFERLRDLAHYFDLPVYKKDDERRFKENLRHIKYTVIYENSNYYYAMGNDEEEEIDE